MKKLAVLIVFFISGILNNLYSQADSTMDVYLLTCDPGTAVYSVYGHSALRITDHSAGTDLVYNWGVFDFSTTHFAWKFAKGRLSYSLGVYTFDRFMQEYFYESRSVYSQKVNLNPDETGKLMELIEENLKPENVSYRYDFFYDDCSTRIRDLLEKVTGKNLIYPPDETSNVPTFREMIGEYSHVYPWLEMGINLLMGMPGDKKALFRDRMFLPHYLQLNLARAVINRDRKMIPLLQPTQVLMEFSPPVLKSPFYSEPMFVFSLLFIVLFVLSASFRDKQFMNYLDIFIFLCYSLLAGLMFFFNFFTDHLQTRENINIIWFNPIIIICLACLIINRECKAWFRAVFFLALVFLPLVIITPHRVDFSLVPIVLILALRSAPRSGFSWYPLTKI